MNQDIDFNTRIVVVVLSAFLLFALIVYVGVSLGVGEDLRISLVVGGGFATALFAIFTWKTLLSLIGIASFGISLWAGNFAKLTPEETLVFSVFACLVTALFFVLLRAFRNLDS